MSILCFTRSAKIYIKNLKNKILLYIVILYCLHTIPMHTYTHTCAHSTHAHTCMHTHTHTISMHMHQMCENTTTCARTVLPLTKQYSRTPDEDYPYLKIIFSSILKLFPPQFHGKDAAYPILQDLDNQCSISTLCTLLQEKIIQMGLQADENSYEHWSALLWVLCWQDSLTHKWRPAWKNHL